MGEPLILDVRGVEIDAAALAPAVEHVRAGGVLCYPTETVYGFGALATVQGVRDVRRLKRRETDRPLLALLPDALHAEGLVWTERARELADIFWPGALTLVLADPDRTFPTGVRSGAGGVGVRVSPHPVVRALLDGLGVALTSTSANEAGGQAARSGGEAASVLQRLGAGVGVMLVDAGALPESAPSTVIDCMGPEPVVLREGSVPVGRLRCVLPEIDTVESS